MNNAAHGMVSSILQPSDFSEPIHGHLYGMMSELIEAGKLASPITMRPYLHEKLQGAGINITAAQYAARLASEATTIVNAVDFAKHIREMADLSTIRNVAIDMVPRAGDTAADIARQAIEQLDSIVAARGEAGQQRFSMKQAMSRAVDASAAAYQNESKIVGISTGFRDLDLKTLGLMRGDMVVVAGRPGMGKSALACTMLRLQAASGYKCLMASLEMSDIQLSHRMQSDLMFDDERVDKVPYSYLRSGNFHEKIFDRITSAALRLSELPIEIDTRPGLTVAQIAARARQLKRTSGLDVLVVDHLDLIKPGQRYNGMRVYEIAEVTGSLKSLAKELDIVVVLLSQLSRDVERREDKRPVLADLRSSGSIEQDADTVIFLYRPSYYLAQTEPEQGTEAHVKWRDANEKAFNLLYAIVAKQRMGPTGTVPLFCDIGCNAVRNLDPEINRGYFPS